MELTGSRPMHNSSTRLTGTQCLVFSPWGLGSGLVSLVPGLGDALGMVGDIEKDRNGRRIPEAMNARTEVVKDLF